MKIRHVRVAGLGLSVLGWGLLARLVGFRYLGWTRTGTASELLLCYVTPVAYSEAEPFGVLEFRVLE